MSETLEMKINKNTEIVFDFYVDKILQLVKIKNKNVILIGLGNTKFIKLIKSVAKNVCIIDHCLPSWRDYKLTDAYQLEIDIKKYLEKNNMSKFDVAIMNPPYDGNLHLKILEAIIPIAKKVVNISPVRWLQDPFAKYKKNSDYIKYEESISKKIESLDIVSAKTANVVFGAIFGMDLAIYTCNNSATVSIDYTRIQNNIVLRVVDYMWKNQPIFDKNKKDGIRIRIPSICGGKSGGSGERKRNQLCEIKDCLGKPLIFTDGMLNGKPWYDYYMKNQYSKTTEEITCSIQFSDENSAKNFYDCVNTKFYKYIHHNVVLDVHIEPCKILFMSDYTQPWTDKRFCEYFNITGYIDDDHAEPGSEWEIILNTMKEYK